MMGLMIIVASSHKPPAPRQRRYNHAPALSPSRPLHAHSSSDSLLVAVCGGVGV